MFGLSIEMAADLRADKIVRSSLVSPASRYLPRVESENGIIQRGVFLWRYFKGVACGGQQGPSS